MSANNIANTHKVLDDFNPRTNLPSSKSYEAMFYYRWWLI